jgi:hypothetical protein
MSDGLMLFLPLIIPAATAVMALALRGRCDLQAGVGVAGALALFSPGWRWWPGPMRWV